MSKVQTSKKETRTDDTNVPYWRQSKSNGRKAQVGKYGIDMGDRGTFDRRNTLNELTGKEWTYFLNSVWVTAYPPIADQCGFDLRKIHPTPKPPDLMRDIINFFTKRDEWVLDPFGGVGGTLLGASLCEPHRNAVGIEINPEYVSAYKKVCTREKLKRQILLAGDARNMLRHKSVSGREFDLILTDPPYADLQTRPKNGQKRKLYGSNAPTPFSELKGDIGNMPYDEFLEALISILGLAVSRLRNKRYLIIFCSDLQPTANEPNLLHADIIKSVLRIPGMRYRGMRIWHDQAVDLYPFGYPYAFVMNQLHQYILIFRKEVL